MDQKWKSKPTPNFLLIGMPCWGIDCPFHALAHVGGIVKSAGWKCKISDLNVGLYNAFSDEDKKFWMDENNSVWAGIEFPQKIYKKYQTIIESTILKEIESDDFDIISFSVNSWTRYFSVEVAKFIKSKRPKIPILFGGVDCFPRELGTKIFSLDKKIPDIILQGEAEIALPIFLKEYAKTKQFSPDIKGFAYREHGLFTSTIIDTGEPDLPLLNNDNIIADYSQFDLSLYSRPGSIPTFLSRGCINRCAFCSESPNFKKFRCRKPEDVLAEIKTGLQYALTYDSCPTIRFSDSIMNGNVNELEKFCDLIIESGIKITWGAQLYFREEMTMEFLQKMYKAGFRSAFWGFESGSSKIIKSMRKNYDMSNAERIILDNHKLGITNVLPIIVGFPGETPQDFISTLTFILRHRDHAKFLGPNSCLVRINSHLHSHYIKYDLSNNNTFDWSSIDNKNNIAVRLLRRFLLKNVINFRVLGANSLLEYDTVKDVDFNYFPVASELVSIMFDLSILCQKEADFKKNIEEFEGESLSGLPLGDIDTWWPANIGREIPLDRFFKCNKNSEMNRKKIIGFLYSRINDLSIQIQSENKEKCK